MDIVPFPERRPRSPLPPRPRTKPLVRNWDYKEVDGRDRLRMEATFRVADRLHPRPHSLSPRTAPSRASASLSARRPPSPSPPAAPSPAFASLVPGPALSALRPPPLSPSVAPSRAREVQFQWAEPPDAVGRAPPIPARSPRRGEIQFQWAEAPDADDSHAPALLGSGLPSVQSLGEYDDDRWTPSHGQSSPPPLPASPSPPPLPASPRPRMATLGTADPSSWMERLALRPVLEQPGRDITRADWLGRPPRTSAEADYYGIGQEDLPPPPPPNTASHSFVNNSAVHTSSVHLAGTDSLDSSSTSGRHRRYSDQSRSSSHYSPGSPKRPRRDGQDQPEDQPTKRSRYHSSHHSSHRRRDDEDDEDDEEEEQPRMRSEHRWFHHPLYRRRDDEDDDLDGPGSGFSRSTDHSSHHTSHDGGNYRRDDSTHSSTRPGSYPSLHDGRHHRHYSSTQSTGSQSLHEYSHRGRNHQWEDSTRAGTYGSSRSSSHHGRDRHSSRSRTDTPSGPPTNSSHGRAASVSTLRFRDTTPSTMAAAQRLNAAFWDVDDDDEEGAPDSSIINRSTKSSSQPAPFKPDVDTETIICAVSESRAGNFVGIATLNLTTGRADVSHIINDDKFQYQRLIDVLSKMEHLPHSFIVPERLAKPGEAKSDLVRCLQKEFPSASIKSLQRSHWSETEGKRIVSESALDGEREAILAVLEKEFYVANAISAVFEYARRELGVAITPHSTRIRYTHPDDTLRLDRTAVSSLELIKTAKEGRSKASSVLQIMDQTHTPAGRRLLRMTLLGPSTDRSEIGHRHNAVEELASNQEFLSAVCKGLKALHRIDMERVITWMFRPEATAECPLPIGSVYSRNGVVLACHDDLQASEWDLNHILMLKEYLGGVAALHKILATGKCSSILGRWLEEQLAPEKLREAQSMIHGGVNEDAAFSTKPIDARNNRIWAIRAQSGSGLEQSRMSYRETTNDLDQHVDELNKVLGDFMGEEGKLRQDSDHRYVLSFSTSVVLQKLPEFVKKAGIHDDFGFHLPQKWADQLPGTNEFTAIRKQTCYVVYTAELFEMSRKTQLFADMATEESDKYVVKLKHRLGTTDRLPMFEMSDAVAILDMICSFSQLSASLNYVRPEMSNQLVLQGARNPVVETRMQNYIPSDVYQGDDSHRCLVLNGGNMSGKSTLVKTVGLIQIMGQMGCFVPANYAQLPLCKQVFTRLSTEDKPENNLGTFGVETTDMNLILRHATEDSLVLIDELGRGTSHSDGLALAKAMVLDLVETKARLIFATHFTEIGPQLREKQPTMITCRHFVAQADSDPSTGTRQITITHDLAPGPMQYKDYGIDLSRRFLPEHITGFAHQVSDFLRTKTNNLSEEDAARPATPGGNMLGKLKLGVRDIINRLAKTSEDADSGTIAIEMKKLQLAVLKRKEGLLDHTSTPPTATPKALPPPMPRLQRPGGRPTEEQLMRWRGEERRVMHNNTPFSSRGGRIAEGGDEAVIEVTEAPRRVFRGRVGGEEEELDDSAELSKMLEEAWGRVHAWLKEDGL